MNHPTSEQARKVAEIFEHLARNEPGRVSMSRGFVGKGKCGTIACHAGWYLMHAHNEGRTVGSRFRELFGWDHLGEDRISKILHLGFPDPLGSTLASWSDGSEMMANDLGFDSTFNLVRWAELNPEIWGNEFGKIMFESEFAFGMDPGEQPTLAEIASHWHRVADRLEALEVKDNPTKVTSEDRALCHV